MADSSVAITEGIGARFDTRRESSLFDHRVVVVPGDAAANSAVAPIRSNTGARASRPAVGGASATSISSSASSVQVLAANPSRRGLYLTNTDANGVYVKFGANASSASFTVFIPGLDFGGQRPSSYQMPEPIYTGRIDAVWVADGSGSLIVTELT